MQPAFNRGTFNMFSIIEALLNILSYYLSS